MWPRSASQDRRPRPNSDAGHLPVAIARNGSIAAVHQCLKPAKSGRSLTALKSRYKRTMVGLLHVDGVIESDGSAQVRWQHWGGLLAVSLTAPTQQRVKIPRVGYMSGTGSATEGQRSVI
jgi:hypothetical protein